MSAAAVPPAAGESGWRRRAPSADRKEGPDRGAFGGPKARGIRAGRPRHDQRAGRHPEDDRAGRGVHTRGRRVEAAGGPRRVRHPDAAARLQRVVPEAERVAWRDDAATVGPIVSAFYHHPEAPRGGVHHERGEAGPPIRRRGDELAQLAARLLGDDAPLQLVAQHAAIRAGRPYHRPVRLERPAGTYWQAHAITRADGEAGIVEREHDRRGQPVVDDQVRGTRRDGA